MRLPIVVEIADQRRMRELTRRYRQNPVLKDVGYELSNWPLYHRLNAAAGAVTAVTLNFFRNVGGLTKNDTNLIKDSELPAPERFKVGALRFIFASRMAFADVYQFLRTYFCEFFIGNSIYQEGPLALYPGGAGVSGFTTRTAQSTWNNGNTDPSAINSMGDSGPEIGQGESFRVVVSGTAFTLAAAPEGTGQDLLCVLDGWKGRAVS